MEVGSLSLSLSLFVGSESLDGYKYGLDSEMDLVAVEIEWKLERV